MFENRTISKWEGNEIAPTAACCFLRKLVLVDIAPLNPKLGKIFP